MITDFQTPEGFSVIPKAFFAMAKCEVNLYIHLPVNSEAVQPAAAIDRAKFIASVKEGLFVCSLTTFRELILS